MFFDVTEEVNPLTSKVERNFRLKKGKANYWERRSKKDWEGLPNIF